MGWRTVYVSSADKLTFSLNNIVLIRQNDKLSIPIDDIDTLIIDNPCTLITPAALNQLCDKRVNVLLCDEKHNPNVSFLPITGYFRQRKRVEEQMSWDDARKSLLWKKIVESKIKNQSAVCAHFGHATTSEVLTSFSLEVETDDTSNREALAARFYFQSVFGSDFTRDDDVLINGALNYGYTLLLSAFNRSVASKGLLPYWGIHHKGEYNAFNLSCDFIEPFRPFVDSWVIKNILPNCNENISFKNGLVSLLQSRVLMCERKEKLFNAIDLFCDECLNYLDNKTEKLTEKSFPAFWDGWWENEI